MKRRVVTLTGVLPPKLAAFTSSDWEGRDEADRYGAWIASREQWKDKRGIVILPDDEDAWSHFPDAPFRIEDV